MTSKSNHKSCIIVLLTFSAQALLFSACGNPILESMMAESISQQPSGKVFDTSDLSGLAEYINENSKNYSRHSPLPIQFTGSDYKAIADVLKDSQSKITDYCYLYLDMRGIIVQTIPDNCFSGEGISPKCMIVAVKLSPNVITIGEGAFYLNTDIISLSMPGIKTIGSKAFYKAYSLQEIFMPASPPPLEVTGNDAFYGIMTNLQFIIHLPYGTQYGEGSDYDKWANKNFNREYINIHFLTDMPGL